MPSGEGRYRNSKEAPSPGTLQVADIYSNKRKGKKPLESGTLRPLLPAQPGASVSLWGSIRWHQGAEE